jgi:hypothetical protein
MMKGIIVKETRALMIITFILFLLNLWIGTNLDDGWFKTLALVYILYSFGDYLCLCFLRKPIYDLPLMSRVRIISDDAIISYCFFKPALLIPVNVFLYIKKQPLMGLKDEIGVDVKAKDGTKININL